MALRLTGVAIGLGIVFQGSAAMPVWANVDIAPASDPRLAAEYTALAQKLDGIYRAGNSPQSIPISARMAEITGLQRGPESDAYVVSLSNHAQNLLQQRRLTEAATVYRSAADIVLRRHQGSEAIVRNVLGNLFTAEYAAGEIDRAHATARRMIALIEADPQASPADLGRWQLRAADPFRLAGSGRVAEAEPWLRKARQTLSGVPAADPLRMEASRRLAALLSLQGRGEEAEPILREVVAAEAGLASADPMPFAADRQQLAGLLRKTGRYREAIGEAQRALALYAQAGPAHRIQANQTKHMLINLFELVGDYASAQPLWEEWLGDPFGSQADGTLSEDRAGGQAILLNGLAENLARQGKAAEAEATYRRALTLATTNDIIRKNSERGLAELLLARGDAATAEPLLRAQFDFWMRKIGTDTWMGPNNLCCATATARAAKILADALSRQGKADEARRLYGLAASTELRFDGPRHPTTGLYHYLHARSLLATAPATALGQARVAMDGARFRRLRATGQSGAAEIDETYRGTSGYFSLMLDALLGPNDVERVQGHEALGIAQEAMVSSTDGAIALMAAQRLRKGLASGLAAALDRRDMLAKDAGAIERQLTADLVSGGNGPERQQWIAQLDAITRQLAATDATIRQDFPEYFDLLRPGPVPLAEAQAALGPDEAVLLFVPGETGVHMVAVTREGLLWKRSMLSSREIDDMARQLLYAAGADVEYSASEQQRWDAGTGGGVDGYPRKTAFALYRQLVEPMLPALAGKRQLFVAAADRLGAMPFSLLVSRAPQGADNDPAALRATRWFVDDFALVQLPSLQSLVALRRLTTKAATRPAADSFVGFGDPLVGGAPIAIGGRGARHGAARQRATAMRGDWTASGPALADLAMLRKLNRLQGTANELRQMAATFGAKPEALHLAEADTETAIRTTDLSHVRILAFATHGLTASEGVGGEPGLVFTPPALAQPGDDGLLTASEAATLRLDADWVILSACNTAAGMGGSSGLTGLARAFFSAGARSVLASYWPVRDDVAAEITTLAIKLQRETPGMRRSEALREAMRRVRLDPQGDRINDAGLNETWAQPNAWAPFMLVGAGQD